MLASIQSSPAKIDRPLQGDIDKGDLNSGGGTPSLDSTCRNSAHSDSRLFNHYLPKLFAKHRPPTHSHNRSHTPSTPTTAEIQGCQRSHSITFKTLFRRPTPLKPTSLNSLISNDTHGPHSEDEETLTSPDGTSHANAATATTDSAQRSQKTAPHSSPPTLPKVIIPTDLYHGPDDDEGDDDDDDDPVGSDAHVSHRMQASERAPSLSSPPSMISAPPAYAMRNLKYQDLESLNDFGSDPAHPESHIDDSGGGHEEDERLLSSQQARNGSKATPAISLPPQALRQSSRAYIIEEESVTAHASVPVSHLIERAETRERPISIRTSTSDRVAMLKSSVCSKWMPHPLSLETYTSIATSPGPMCDINSSADSQPPCSAQGMTMSADEIMASPARRLHRFLHAASTGKMLALSQLQGESEHLQPVEEKTDRGQDMKHNSPNNDRCKRSCQTSSSLASENMSSSSSASSASTGNIKDGEEDEGDLEDDNAQNVYSRDRPIHRYSLASSTSPNSTSRPPSNRESPDLQCVRPRGRPTEAQQRPKCQISMSRSRTPPVLTTPRDIELAGSRPSKTPLRTRPVTPNSNTSPILRPRPSAVGAEAKGSDDSRRSTLKSPMAGDDSVTSSNRSKHESSPHVESSANGPSGSPSSGAAFPLASPSISSSANFPISSPFLQWMVQSSSNAQAVCSNESPPTVTALAKSGSSKIVDPYVRRPYDGSSETTKPSVSASPSRLSVPAQKQNAGLGRMSPVAEESEVQADASTTRYEERQAPRGALQSPSSAGQKSSSHFETANEEFISAQETQDGEGGGHGPIIPTSVLPAGHDRQRSTESPGNVMRGTDKETVMVKSRGGETTGDSSSADRKRHKSPVQRIVSALTKRLFTAPESQSRSSPSTEQWGKSNEQSSVCRERYRRQEKMKHAMARVLDEPRSPEENSSETTSGFDLRDTCNDLKLRCFPKILTPVRASTCTGTTRAASQQTTARHRHVSTFSQPTPPSSRLYNPRGESPPTCSCRLGPSSAGDTSSLGNSLKFALPQPRTASSIGASSWRRCLNGPMVVQSRGVVMSSRPCSSSSSYQSTDSSMRLLSPPKGGMRTLVGVFSAVEDAALKKYYDCLEDLKRRGDPLATTFSNEQMSPPMDVAYYERRDGCARCSQCKWHGEKTFLVRDRSIMTDDTTQDRSTAEACMEVVEDGSTSHSEDDGDDDYSDDEEYRMFEEEWLSSRGGLLDESIHSDDIRVGIPPMCVLRRGCAMMNDESSRDARPMRRHSKHYLHTHDVPHYRQTLYAIKSAPAIPRDTLLTEEEAERRLRRFLSHVVMKRRLKRIKLLQDSATKIQRWYRAQRQLSRFTADETLSLESSIAMSSPRLLPPPKHKILPDGRILNVPRASAAFVSSVEKRESGSRRSGRHTADKCDDLVRHIDENGHNTTWVIKARSAGGPRLPYPPSRSRHSRDGYICSRGGVYNVSEASRSSRGDIFRGGGVKVSECTSGSLLTEDEWASELESCLWRKDNSYGDRGHHRERDIAVRVYPRPPVKGLLC